MTPASPPAEVSRREVNGVTLETAVAGPEGGPIIVLLHGFPDLWQGWHLLIGPLAISPPEFWPMIWMCWPKMSWSSPLPKDMRHATSWDTTGAEWWPGGPPRDSPSAFPG